MLADVSKRGRGFAEELFRRRVGVGQLRGEERGGELGAVVERPHALGVAQARRQRRRAPAGDERGIERGEAFGKGAAHELAAELPVLVVDLGGDARVLDSLRQRGVDRRVERRGERLHVERRDLKGQLGAVAVGDGALFRGDGERLRAEPEQRAAVLRRGGPDAGDGGELLRAHRAETVEIFRKHLLRRDGVLFLIGLPAEEAARAEQREEHERGGDPADRALFLFCVAAVLSAHRSSFSFEA